MTANIEEHNRVVDYKDIVDLETMRGYLERYDPKQTFTVYQLITMINAAINRRKIQRMSHVLILSMIGTRLLQIASSSSIAL